MNTDIYNSTPEQLIKYKKNVAEVYLQSLIQRTNLLSLEADICTIHAAEHQYLIQLEKAIFTDLAEGIIRTQNEETASLFMECKKFISDTKLAITNCLNQAELSESVRLY